MRGPRAELPYIPGTLGFSSEPGGRIACVHGSTIGRAPGVGALGFPSCDSGLRFFELRFLSRPSEVQAASFTVPNMRFPGQGSAHESVTNIFRRTEIFAGLGSTITRHKHKGNGGPLLGC